MVNERPSRRKRRAPHMKASRRKIPPKNGRAVGAKPPPRAAEGAISAEALAMRNPDLRRQVIQSVARKLFYG